MILSQLKRNVFESCAKYDNLLNALNEKKQGKKKRLYFNVTNSIMNNIDFGEWRETLFLGFKKEKKKRHTFGNAMGRWHRASYGLIPDPCDSQCT